MTNFSGSPTARSFYAFFVEQFDNSNGIVRRYRLNYYPGIAGTPAEIEMFDAQYGKTYLRRGIYSGLFLDHLHLGARLKIYAREVRVVGYADDWTRDQLAVSTLSCHRNDERFRSICDVPRKLQPYMPPGTQTVNGSPKKHEGCDAMLKSLLNELGEEFFTAEMKQDPEAKAAEARKKFEELRDAVHWGNVGAIPKLLRNGASMYLEDDAFTKKTLFHIAAERDQADCIRKLHSLKSTKLPDPIHRLDHTNCSALHYAASRGNPEPIVALVELRADMMQRDELNMAPIHKAARAGHEHVVRVLAELGSGLDPHDRDKQAPIHLAASLGKDNVIQVLAEVGANMEARDKDGRTALHFAADRGHVPTAELLVRLNGDVEASDISGGKPIHVASMNGQLKVIELLVSLGADINSIDMYKETPLHRAASLGKDEVVKFLVTLKAQVDATDKYGETALHRAAAMGQESTIRTLNQLGAIQEPRDYDDRTPLHVAASNWRRHAITELTDHGCELSTKDKYKETPLHRAAAMGQKASMHMLVEMGALVQTTNDKGESGLERLARRENEHKAMMAALDDEPLDM